MKRTQTVIPQLRMTDAERSLRFYVEGLGFAEDWRHQFEPGLPLFVQLTRDGKNTSHDVQAITKEGRTELDITLQNGDQVYVDAKPVVGFGN